MLWFVGTLVLLFLFRRPIKRLFEEAAAAAAAEKRKLNAEARTEAEAEQRARALHRDAEWQRDAYEYQCVGHPNATLAIRYGIANMEKYIEEYWYHGPGGVQTHNPDRDKIKYRPATTIAVRKIRKIEPSHYLAELPGYGDREVRVVIELGTESVKTFYPIADSWFEDHKELERVLKDNKTFTLKELATFHVQKVIPTK